MNMISPTATKKRHITWAAVLTVLAYGCDALAQGEDIRSRTVQVSAHIEATSSNATSGELIVTVALKPGQKTYSVTQQGPGPNRTRIAIEPSDDYSVVGKPEPTHEPTIVRYEEIWPDRDIEVHEGTITWRMPLTRTNVDLAEIEVLGAITMQVETADNAVMAHQVFRAVLATKDD